MKKPLKLTRNALLLAGLIVLGIICFIVFEFGGHQEKVPVKKEITPAVINNVVLENQVLKVKLLDFVSSKDYQDSFQEVSLTIEPDETILGYKMQTKQTFTKVMKLLPPDENALLLNNSSEVPSHEAYVLVLSGDVVEYQKDNQLSYQIVNARIDYYRQALLLENDYNSVYIASIDGKKEKMVKIDAYKQALSDPSGYMSMLQW